MKKEVIIICESIYHGNTIKLAKAIAFALDCEIVSPQEALLMDLSQYKIVGLGSGIYFTSHHPKIIEALNSLNSGQQAFIFSTHGSPFLGSYHDSIKEELVKRSISVIGEFSCKGFDCTGPFIIIKGGNKGRPNEKDEQKAIKFISRILPQYVKNLNDVPKGHFVHVNEDCIACGKCIVVCPMNVFAINDNKAKAVDELACTHCSLCLEACPNRAISIKHGFVDAIRIAKRHARKKSL
ncbi:MAG: hypothetical protein CVU91_11885 [Firmicutes bacterium HGW-Firmicutes-16]|nr:MAG: hypothetical protein CVU91_11885 [Firmicutes bacterium HGW-Firmicutes-16]